MHTTEVTISLVKSSNNNTGRTKKKRGFLNAQTLYVKQWKWQGLGLLQESSECYEDHWTWIAIFVQEPELSLTIHWRADRPWQLPAELPSHTFWRRRD